MGLETIACSYLAGDPGMAIADHAEPVAGLREVHLDEERPLDDEDDEPRGALPGPSLSPLGEAGFHALNHPRMQNTVQLFKLHGVGEYHSGQLLPRYLTVNYPADAGGEGGAYLRADVALVQEFAERIVPLITLGRVSPIVHCSMELAEAADAHMLMERNDNFGKIVLRA